MSSKEVGDRMVDNFGYEGFDIDDLREELVSIEVRDVELRQDMQRISEDLGSAFENTLMQREINPDTKEEPLEDSILSLSQRNDLLHNEHIVLMKRRKIVLDKLIKIEKNHWDKE